MGNEKGLSSRTGCIGLIPILEIIQVTREALVYILPYIFNAGQGKMQKKRHTYCWNQETIFYVLYITNNPGILLLRILLPNVGCHALSRQVEHAISRYHLIAGVLSPSKVPRTLLTHYNLPRTIGELVYELFPYKDIVNPLVTATSNSQHVQRYNRSDRVSPTLPHIISPNQSGP